MSLITPGEAAAPTARQDDSRKQLGAFLRARREASIRSAWGYRAAGGGAHPACAVKKWRCWQTLA